MVRVQRRTLIHPNGQHYLRAIAVHSIGPFPTRLLTLKTIRARIVSNRLSRKIKLNEVVELNGIEPSASSMPFLRLACGSGCLQDESVSRDRETSAVSTP